MARCAGTLQTSPLSSTLQQLQSGSHDCDCGRLHHPYSAWHLKLHICKSGLPGILASVCRGQVPGMSTVIWQAACRSALLRSRLPKIDEGPFSLLDCNTCLSDRKTKVRLLADCTHAARARSDRLSICSLLLLVLTYPLWRD